MKALVELTAWQRFSGRSFWIPRRPLEPQSPRSPKASNYILPELLAQILLRAFPQTPQYVAVILS